MGKTYVLLKRPVVSTIHSFLDQEGSDLKKGKRHLTHFIGKEQRFVEEQLNMSLHYPECGMGREI